MKYAWQARQWQQFWQSVQAGRLPHALLLTGMAGTGKTAFAFHTAQALLCQQVSVSGDPCDHCHSCRLVVTLAHPNMYHVVPEKDGHAIKVDQIRELTEFVQKSSLQGEYRIVVINPAHSMNINAANALLKTLEEPAAGAILLLVTDQISHLPATVRSRCQRILFPRPDQQEALSWLRAQAGDATTSLEQALRLAHGAPLLALATLQDKELPVRDDLFKSFHQLIEKRADPLTLAAKWQKMDPVIWIELALGWVSDMIRLQLGGNITQLLNQDYEQALNISVTRVPLQKNLQLLESLLTARGKMSAGVNFNKQLMIESLLIRWSEPSI